MPEIETTRLWLRPFLLKDLDALAEIWADPIVMRHMRGRTPRTREQTEAGLIRIMQHQVEHGFSLWAVVLKAEAKLLGFCGLQYLDSTPEVEMGWLLAKEYWRRGLATEAATAWLQYGFETLKLDRIVAITRPENIASRGVMEKIGMHYEKDARYYETDCVYYAIDRQQWQDGRA